MMRNWRVEDNLVTLYIAKHKYKDLVKEALSFKENANKLLG